MGLVEGVEQAGCRHVGVDLRGHEALVAQEFLHAADIGTGIEQVRRETVTQRVRARPPRESRGREMLLEQSGDTADRQPSAKTIGEQGA